MTTGVTQAAGVTAVPGTGGGGVTSITFGTGLTGGTISTTGTVTVDPAQAVAYSVAQGYSIALAANTSGDGLTLTDPTAAAAASQQFSPRLRLRGQGWATTPVASQPVDWIVENQPTQGTTNPGTNLVFSSSVNGGAYTAWFTLAQNGSLVLPGSLGASVVTPTAATLSISGINRPVANSLGFSSNNVLRGSFDANGNFIHLFARADQSKSVQTPLTGFSITIGNNTSTLYLTPAGTLATGSIALPTTPIDGQEIQVGSSQIITALTVTSSQTILDAPTTIGTVGSGFKYIYHLATTTWLRLY